MFGVVPVLRASPARRMRSPISPRITPITNAVTINMIMVILQYSKADVGVASFLTLLYSKPRAAASYALAAIASVISAGGVASSALVCSG